MPARPARCRHAARRLVIAVGFALTAALGTAPARAAGTVEVRFAEGVRHVDAGPSRWDAQRVEHALGAFLAGLGRELPANRRVVIDVKDIDLAGELRWLHDGSRIRVLTGRADAPRITLHAELWQDGRIVRAGEERVSDLAYSLVPPVAFSGTDLPHEKRMLAAWFRERFVDDAR